MKVEIRPIDRVRPYDRNPRLNDGAVDAVAESIREFGVLQPLVVDSDGVIIVGHTRWKAAQKLGLEKVPVVVARDLTPEQVRAYRIADNKTGELAEWDPELLPVELSELAGCGIDWTDLGFGERELSELLGDGVGQGNTDPDAVPEPPDDPTTQPGDLWVLGDHRLLCGDSASEADLDRLLDGATVQLVNTDPPYNVAVEPRSNNAIRAGLSSFPEAGGRAYDDRPRTPGSAEKGGVTKMRAKDRPLDNDWLSEEDFAKVLAAWFGNAARVLDPGRGFYIWGGYSNVANYPPALEQAGLYFSQAIIWHKLHPVIGRKDFMGDHEWCFYGWKEGKAHQFFGPNNVGDVWPIKKVSPNAMVHLTEKPVELAVRALQYSTKRGECVLDLFGGSGSTLIAAEQTGRRAFLMEIDPAYCDVIVQRWEAFTGGKAERVPTTSTKPAKRKPTKPTRKKRAPKPGTQS